MSVKSTFSVFLCFPNCPTTEKSHVIALDGVSVRDALLRTMVNPSFASQVPDVPCRVKTERVLLFEVFADLI